MISKIRSLFITKKTLYILCFMALNLIDLLRTTQNGDIWKTAVNCTGLVVMILIAGAYPFKRFVEPFSCVWTGLCACAVFAAAIQKGDSVCGMYKGILITALLNVWWILLFYKVVMWPKIRERKNSFRLNGLGWVWVVLTLFMTFSKSGRLWPAWFFVMFVLFYMTEFSARDRKYLVEAMVDGTILSFFAIQIFAYGFRPFDRLRYVGAFSNSNMAALHYLVVYVMILVKLHLLEMKGAGRFQKLFFLTGASGLLGFMFLTMGRTSWVTSIVVTVLYGVLVVRKRWKKTWGKVIARGAALALGAVILFPLVFATVRWLPTILHHPIWFQGEYAVDKVHSFDPADSPKYTDMDEFLKGVFDRIAGTLHLTLDNPLVLKARAAEAEYEVVEQVGSEDMDEAVRGRLSIYKLYLENLTWFGHSEQEGHFVLAGTMFMVWHGHNTWIQIAYFYGIPAGICFVLFTVVVLTNCGKREKREESLFGVIPLLVCVTYFVYGIMEINWESGQYILFLLFFVHHPKLFSGGDDLKSEGEMRSALNCEENG